MADFLKFACGDCLRMMTAGQTFLIFFILIFYTQFHRFGGVTVTER